jgi:ribosomal protein S19E (S16A)
MSGRRLAKSGARKVLARLTEAGVVARQHRETSTRMRGRVMLLPVARAYGRSLVPAEAVSGAGSVFRRVPQSVDRPSWTYRHSGGRQEVSRSSSDASATCVGGS